MQTFNIVWDTNRQTYYYNQVLFNNYSNIDDSIDKYKKNEPIKKFNRWFDKFNLIQTEQIDENIITLIHDNFNNIDNVTSNDIKSLLKTYKLNNNYKLIPSIYCTLKGKKFFISDEFRNIIKDLFTKIIINTSFYINYTFFLKNALIYLNEMDLSNSIPSIKSLDKHNEYVLIWKNFRNSL